MRCPICSEEMKNTEEAALLTCSGPSWSPHDAISYHAESGIYHTTSPLMVQWFREHGFAITFAGNGYEIRQRKGVLARLFHK